MSYQFKHYEKGQTQGSGSIVFRKYSEPSPTPSVNPYLTFRAAEPFQLTLGSSQGWDGIIEFSNDAINWQTYSAGTAFSSGTTNEVYVRGTGNTIISNTFKPTKDVYCEGNIEVLLDYQTVIQGGHPPMGQNAFESTFYHEILSGYGYLLSCPDLMSTLVSEGGYSYMFDQQIKLTHIAKMAPAILSKNSCAYMYRYCTGLVDLRNDTIPTMLGTIHNSTIINSPPMGRMFDECSNLMYPPTMTIDMSKQGENTYARLFQSTSNNIPIIDASNITITGSRPAHEWGAEYTGICYYMFAGCANLRKSPVINVGNIDRRDFSFMFDDCIALQDISGITLPSTISANGCQGMFMGCTGLLVPPKLPATSQFQHQPGTTANSAYANMFNGCTNLTKVPAIYLLDFYRQDCKNMFANSSVSFSSIQDSSHHYAYRFPYTGTATVASNATGTNVPGYQMDGTNTLDVNTTYYVNLPVLEV